MSSTDSSSVELLQPLLERAGQGDAAALDELLRRSAQRLTELARRMLRGFPGVRRWADTDDVLQNALVRLVGSLRDVTPASPREFLGLATLQIRRELIDLARHYYGPLGQGANHESRADDSRHPLAAGPADENNEPSSLAQWREFHEQVGALPPEEREVVSLLYYQDLPQAVAAELLSVSIRTVQRRWHSALQTLHRVWNGEA
jgi:RNA polymerase sigma-70 factor (ECF subfamily)